MSQTSQRYDFPFHVTDGPDGLTFAAFLYETRAERRGVLQVLMHGNSYDHRYWDAGRINGEDYSYARYMTEQGFDLLAIDMPGVGASSTPNGFSVSIDAVGKALGDLLQRLRDGSALPGRTYGHISSVGHSMGSILGVYAEAQYPAADSLIVTGTGYFPGRSSSGWAPGEREELIKEEYSLVPPGHRRRFYHAPSADPDVIDYDNAVLRTRMPSGLWGDCIPLRDAPNSGVSRVTCPVYVQLGEKDPIMAGEYADQERGCYTSSPDVRSEQLPDMGHSFNLHLNRELSWRGISAYLDR